MKSAPKTGDLVALNPVLGYQASAALAKKGFGG